LKKHPDRGKGYEIFLFLLPKKVFMSFAWTVCRHHWYLITRQFNGCVWLKRDQKYRSHCSIKKSDTAIHSLSFSSISDCRMNSLAVDSVQIFSYTNVPTVTPSRGTPWYRKSSCVNGETGRYYDEMCKYIQTPREGPVRQICERLPYHLSTTGCHKLRPLCIWGDEWGQPKVLLLWETWKPREEGNPAIS